VGEGRGDAALIRYLCENRNISGFQFEDALGASKFETFLSGLRARKGFHALKGIIVVADCDDQPDDRFRDIYRQLKAAKLPVPNGPYTYCQQKNVSALATFVLMVPFSGQPFSGMTPIRGALETIILPAAEAHASKAQIDCLNAYCSCAEINNLGIAARDKTRLRSLIAMSHPDDPNITLPWAIRPGANLIPLDHPCFNDLAEVIRQLPSRHPG